MYRCFRRTLPLLLATTVLAACEPDTGPGPIVTPPDPTVRSFSGTLTVNGGVTHRFTTLGSGDIRVRLTTLAPDATVVVNLSLGVWTGASCNMMIENQTAVVNTVVVGVAAATGEFCARVFDLGRLVAPTDYTIEVNHF
jgi:hypothetical protein